MIIVRRESLIDISLPYLVYMIKIIIEINPKIKKSHAKIHNVKEGASNGETWKILSSIDII
ncbi:MAG: hypothetical protein ACFFFB_00580 [Candidatus Heimdallarchaeota archaeon]